MTERRLDITLTLTGPVLTRSTSAGDYGVDAPMARTSGDHPILPGTLVKGKLREAWEELRELPDDPLGLADTLTDWLGQGDDEAASAGTETRRGRLIFSDFVSDADSRAVRHRIHLDPATGAVRPHFFQTVETPFAPGQEVRFAGAVRFIPRDDSEARALERALEAGLRWIPSLGALRTVGFGRVLAVEIDSTSGSTTTSVPAASPPPSVKEGDRGGFDLLITIEDPFCLTRPGPVGNLFESGDVLPGAALKGALATTWRELLGESPNGPVHEDLDPEWPELSAQFDRLRFGHAFPTRRQNPKRPAAPPLSLVKVGARKEEKLYDVLLAPGPGLIETETGSWRAPSFAADWKGRADVDRQFGWPALSRELRVRTAIDRRTRRAASEQLFALETVVPDDEVVWAGKVDLGAIAEAETRERVAEQLADLLARGLRGLGKTKARARVELRPAGSIPPVLGQRDPGAGAQHALLLQTPAILCDPGSLRASSAGDSLYEAYARVWEELSAGSLRLSRFFAAQELAGGEYLWHRFQGGDEYHPYLLTSAGSVFLLEAVDGRTDEARSALERWQAHGLPLPSWAEQRYGIEDPRSRWRSCPFLPENGYGEVLVDRILHWDRRPSDQHFRPLEQEAG